MKKFFLIKWIKTIIDIYIDGFKHGITKKLLLIIAIKFFIMFAILKMFFFRDYLDEKFDSDEQKSKYVLENLTNQIPRIENQNEQQ